MNYNKEITRCRYNVRKSFIELEKMFKILIFTLKHFYKRMNEKEKNRLYYDVGRLINSLHEYGIKTKLLRKS